MPQPRRLTWDAELVAWLAAAWEDRVSIDVMRVEVFARSGIPCSYNTIFTFAARQGWKPRGHKSKRVRAYSGASGLSEAQDRAQRHSLPAPVPTPLPTPPAVRPPERQPRSTVCCWPIGDPGEPDFHFCGAPCQDRRRYCGAHVAQAFVRRGDHQ